VSWTRLDDLWTERDDLAGLDYPDRWHYLALIQACSRRGALTGELRTIDARRASDHPDPDRAQRNLIAAGLIEPTAQGIRVIEIADHVPPPSVRDASTRAAERKRRQRAHEAGDHHLCLPERCPLAPGPRDIDRDNPRDPGTGQDRTGEDYKVTGEGPVELTTSEPYNPAIYDETGQDRAWFDGTPVAVPGSGVRFRDAS